jgi:hypothetical protein
MIMNYEKYSSYSGRYNCNGNIRSHNVASSSRNANDEEMDPTPRPITSTVGRFPKRKKKEFIDESMMYLL